MGSWISLAKILIQYYSPVTPVCLRFICCLDLLCVFCLSLLHVQDKEIFCVSIFEVSKHDMGKE